MHWILIFYIFHTGNISSIDFDRKENCEIAAKELMKEFDEEPDSEGKIEHNSFYHCVEK